MNEGIFENFFGEKPHEQGAKRIANGALNSYNIGLFMYKKYRRDYP
jgi:hypothetical protein